MIKLKRKIRCPECGAEIDRVIGYWETDEEGERRLGWGYDVENVRWYLVEVLCPVCHADLGVEVREKIMEGEL